MAVLAPGRPMTVDVPELLVENRLSPGRYRFELVVTDTSGLESAPALLAVTVFEPAPVPTPTPGPVIRPEVLDRVDRVTPVDRATVVTNPTILQPIRRPQ